MYIGGNNMRPSDPARVAAVYERRKQAMRLKHDGYTWAEIAPAVGYKDGKHAASDVHKYLDRLRKEQSADADALRQQQLAHLAELRQRVDAIMERRHIHVTPGGKIVKDEDGNVVLDDAVELAAIDRMLKIAEREGKILGTDAPEKLEAGVTINYSIDGVDMNQV